LFAPFDCCALVYRDPAIARAAHTQQAGYLDVLTESADYSPADYAVGLTRRARGLPFWFSLATYGTRAYTEALERTLAVARHAADEIRRRDYLDLVAAPDLSVVVFRRRGWTSRRYQVWSDDLLAVNFAFVVPTVHEGETVARFAIVNPRTTEADIADIHGRHGVSRQRPLRSSPSVGRAGTGRARAGTGVADAPCRRGVRPWVLDGAEGLTADRTGDKE
jgi:glutamate/tyrosine decarboxylase-like PLP-dependent enzyme